MRRSLDRYIVQAAIGIFVALLLLVGAAQWQAGHAVPPAFRYVLPNATGYVVTGPLRDLWNHAPRHLSRVLSRAASTKGQEMAKGLNEALAERCLAWDDLSDVSKLGIDGTRGAALSLVDEDALLAVAVTDLERFALFAERMLVRRQLTLLASSPADKTVKAIRIDSNESEGVAFCPRVGDKKTAPLPDGTVIELNESEGEESAAFFVSRALAGKSAVKVRCSAIFTDGSEGDCECRFRDEETSDCSAEPALLAPMQAPAAGSGRLRPVLSMPRFQLHLLDGHVALVTSNPSLAEAAARTYDNFGFFRGDDSFLATARQLAGIAGEGDGVIVGAVPAQVLPISGRTHFALALAPQQLTGRLLVPWQTLQSTFLEQLIAPAPRRAAVNAALLSDDAELRIDDPALGYYLRFIEDYGEASKRHLERLGTFQVFFREIAKIEHVGPFRFAVRGIRDGVPDLVMTLALPRATAESLLLKQRIEMRQARDVDILAAAAKRFREEHPTEPLNEVEQLLPYLKDEPGAFWERYKIEQSETKPEDDAPEPVSIKLAEDFTAEDFTSAAYDELRDGRRFQYVPPPITDNDLLYRVKSDADNAVDETALKAGRFRMAALIDDAEGRLIVASDIDTLSAVAAQPRSPDAGDRGRVPAASKLSVLGDPAFLTNQGLLYPDKQVNDTIRGYLLELEQYRRLKLSVEPLANQQGIGATIVLSHD